MSNKYAETDAQLAHRSLTIERAVQSRVTGKGGLSHHQMNLWKYLCEAKKISSILVHIARSEATHEVLVVSIWLEKALIEGRGLTAIKMRVVSKTGGELSLPTLQIGSLRTREFVASLPHEVT